MASISQGTLAAYWSAPEVATNFIIVLNLLGALALGLIVGYERSYHGRAAGMRAYGLVCMASAAITVIAGYPHYWFGGLVGTLVGPDPTRVIQGIVTGIGFLGAGIIMREGFNISGLTTAASIWASSAIGIMVGVGFYVSAIFLALLSAASMMWISRLENWLPSRQAIAVVMQFEPGYRPSEELLHQLVRRCGYTIAAGSLSITREADKMVWHFVSIERVKRSGAQLSILSDELITFDGVADFQLSHARN
jgi:putative Mg2+ transporter-C (MgtC) family protein